MHKVHGPAIRQVDPFKHVDRMLSDEELRSRARRIAEAKIAFYIHFSVYLMVNSFFVLLWWFTGGLSVFPWFIFPVGLWGIGVVAHYIGAFGGGSYIDRKADEEFKRLKKQQGL